MSLLNPRKFICHVIIVYKKSPSSVSLPHYLIPINSNDKTSLLYDSIKSFSALKSQRKTLIAVWAIKIRSVSSVACWQKKKLAEPSPTFEPDHKTWWSSFPRKHRERDLCPGTISSFCTVRFVSNSIKKKPPFFPFILRFASLWRTKERAITKESENGKSDETLKQYSPSAVRYLLEFSCALFFFSLHHQQWDFVLVQYEFASIRLYIYLYILHAGEEKFISRVMRVCRSRDDPLSCRGVIVISAAESKYWNGPRELESIKEARHVWTGFAISDDDDDDEMYRIFIATLERHRFVIKTFFLEFSSKRQIYSITCWFLASVYLLTRNGWLFLWYRTSAHITGRWEYTKTSNFLSLSRL